MEGWGRLTVVTVAVIIVVSFDDAVAWDDGGGDCAVGERGCHRHEHVDRRVVVAMSGSTDMQGGLEQNQ